MKMRIRLRMILFGLLLSAWPLPGAELLDRIAISVDNEVITEQQIYRQSTIAAFLDGKEPQFTQQSLRETADRMVLQRLMMRDMRANGFPPPGEEDMQAMLTQLQQTHWESAESFWQSASKAGISRETLRQFLSDLLATLRYIDFRFRPAIRASDTALLERYQEKYSTTSGPVDPPPFEQVREALEAELIEEGVDEAVDRWLEDAKQRAGVRYRPEVLP